MRALIIGGDSQIGRALVRHLSAAGDEVVSTTRRQNLAGGSRPFCDLNQSPEQWQIPDGVRTTYLLAAVSRMKDCRRDPENSRRINVDAQCILARRLHQLGSFIVFVSTNQVYNGHSPFRPSTDPPDATSAYGRQKADAEKELAEAVPGCAIVRLTKVVGIRDPLLADWVGKLRNGEPITPFYDMVMSPVPLHGVSAVLGLVGSMCLSGITQVSGEKDLTYAEAGQLAAAAAGADPGLVRPIGAVQSGLIQETPPANTTLDMERLIAEFGIAPPPVSWTLDWALKSCLEYLSDKRV